MHRRRFLGRSLAGAGLAGAGLAGGAALAGCLDLAGGRDPPPVLDDRPDGVYRPTRAVGSRLVGVREAGDYRVALAYSPPVRFWTVTGTRVRRVSVADEDAVHLLATVRERETGVALPDAGVTVEVRRDGEAVYEEVVYPMLAGRVGVHHGDNVPLPGDGEYAVRVTVGGPGGRPRGGFAGRFGEPASTEFALGYSRREREAIPVESTDDRAGEAGAPEPQPPADSGSDGGGGAADGGGTNGGGGTADGGGAADGGGTDGGDGTAGGGGAAVSSGTVPAADDLPGRPLATVERGDAVFVLVLVAGGSGVDGSDGAGGEGDGDYLAVSARSRYNRYPLPAMGLTATLRRGGEVVSEGVLRAAVGPEFGYHYGATLDGVEPGDALSVAIPTTPQVARHEGYETAFRGLEGFEIRV